jgi:tetratricopeptide (TPR) repeat protein
MEKDSSEIVKLKERIAKDPKSKLFVPLAEEYKKIGDVKTAVGILTEGLKNNPGYVTARSFLGRLLLESGDFTGAQKELEEVIKAIPDNLLAQRKLGDLHVLRGNPDEALKRYKTALALNPGDKEITSFIADLEAGKDISARIPGSKQSAAPAQAAKVVPPTPPGKPAPPSASVPAKPQAQPAASVSKPSVVAATPQKTRPEPIPPSPLAAEPTAERKAAPERVSMVSPAPASRGTAVPPPASAVEEVTQPAPSAGTSTAARAPLQTPSPGEEAPSLDAILSIEEPFDAAPSLSVEKGPEGETVEEIIELEPLEHLAAEAAALHQERSPKATSAGAQASPAPPPGEFDLSEPMSEPVHFGEERPGEWTPPAEVQTEQPAEEVPEETSDDINTDTLAELYISQAFYEKAIEIYERMLSERPGTAALELKLQKLRALAASAEQPGSVVAPSSPDMQTPEAPPAKAYVPPPAERGQREIVEPIEAPKLAIPPKAPPAAEVQAAAKEPRPTAAPRVEARVDASRPVAGTDDTLKAMQEALEGADRQEPEHHFGAGAAISSSPPAATARRKETLDRLENWLKNIMKEKPG